MRSFFDFLATGLSESEPEHAHELALRALEWGVHPRSWRSDDSRLGQKLFGLRFSNPIGMAAGFDKDARVVMPLFRMGFGFVEAGTVTPLPQDGNAKPRLFRLEADAALVNRMGFNNQGFAAAVGRIARDRPGVLGVNIGPNRHSTNRVADYIAGLTCFADFADYLTINVSSPNTQGLRSLQDPRALDDLLAQLSEGREAMHPASLPILIKLAPDLRDDEIPAVVASIRRHGMDGIIVANTTVVRERLVSAAHTAETGGLSGRPLFERSTRMLARIHLLTEGQIPLIGVGGIDAPARALDKIEAGASLIQLYTGLVYSGPSLVKRIKRKLIRTLRRERAPSIRTLVGRKAETWAGLRL